MESGKKIKRNVRKKESVYLISDISVRMVKREMLKNLYFFFYFLIYTRVGESPKKFPFLN